LGKYVTALDEDGHTTFDDLDQNTKFCQEGLEDDIRLVSGTYQFRAFFHTAPSALQRSEIDVPKMKSPGLLG
jgi:hypothetical protein